MAKGFVGHHRSEVRPPDADIDDVADVLPVWPRHSPRGLVGEVGHAIQDPVNLGDDVDAVHDERRVAGACEARCAGRRGPRRR